MTYFTELSPDHLGSLRTETDPLADKVLIEIISSGEEEKINEVMMKLFKNSSFHLGMFSSLSSNISTILDQYIETSGQLPEWYDEKMVKKGEKLFSLYGPEIFMLLNVSSLPLCYTCAKGAQVLFDTGRLLSHNKNMDPLARRLMETAQMVVNVLASGGLTESGRGVVTIQKVRLIHASIRYYLKTRRQSGWDTDKLGEPINQEDLLGTLMSFGPVIINGLRRLNIKLSSDEIESYMHCWKVVGYLMGIRSDLLPNSYSDGFDLATKILKNQAASSEAGKSLTSSCIEFINYLIPGNAFDSVPNYFMHYFLEDFAHSSGVNLAECLGLLDKKSSRDKISLAVSKWLVGEMSHLEESEFMQKIASFFNRKLLEGIIHHFNDGKTVQFYIPPSLQEDWGLSSKWENTLTTKGILNHRLALQKKSETIATNE